MAEPGVPGATLDQGVLDIGGLVKPAEVAELRRAFYAAVAAGKDGNATLSTRTMTGDADLTGADEIARTLGDPQAHTIAGIRSRIISATKSSFAAPDIMPTWSAFTEMRVGASIGLHADAERETPGGWEQNHSFWLSHVTLLYLGTSGIDFRGGDLVLPEVGRTIAPVAGQLVGFPSGRKHQHGVTTIESGTRLSIAVWFTRDAGRCEQGWPA